MMISVRMNRSILLVEDEPEIADLISLHLSDMDMQVEHASDGIRGLTLSLQKEWQLILLDLNLPGIDGLEICKQVREWNKSTPIILITARTSEAERVEGLDAGADDYITKPFSAMEFAARVRAMFRRIDLQASSTSSARLLAGDIMLDRKSREVTVAGSPVELTAKEFDMLAYFAESPGQVFKRSELLEKVWGYSHQGYLHTVNSHINRLRSKIEVDPSKPAYVKTVWGVGYKLACESE